MNYMYSINANNGQMTLYVNFDVKTDPNTDQILAQMRQSQAESQLPSDVRNYGVTVQKSTSAPLIMFALYSPNGTYDDIFLANYCLHQHQRPDDPRAWDRQRHRFSVRGQYAMRFWVKPDQLAKLNITIPEIVNAIQAQNTVNPGRPDRRGTGAQGPGIHLRRARPGTSGRARRSSATSSCGRNLTGRWCASGMWPASNSARRPTTSSGGSTANLRPSSPSTSCPVPTPSMPPTAPRSSWNELKASFPPDLDVRRRPRYHPGGHRRHQRDRARPSYEALVLVIIVVFLFLQGWRATLIPLLAVPVSLIGTFALFPLFGFSINTLSLFGLVLAIGLVVDDAIVVVEAVEHHIEHGLSPKEATFKAMEEVSGPVIAIAIILAAVFVPTAFIPGITGRLYQQFAVTIAVSVIISAFNALTLSPALSALLLRPKKASRGPLAAFFRWFNRMFDRATGGYVSTCALLIRKSAVSLLLLAAVTVLTGIARPDHPDQLPSRRRPGLPVCRRAAARCGLAAAHRCRHEAGRGDPRARPRG